MRGSFPKNIHDLQEPFHQVIIPDALVIHCGQSVSERLWAPCMLNEVISPEQPRDPLTVGISGNDLVRIIDTRHELVRLAIPIDMNVFDWKFGAPFDSTTGCAALPTRLVAGLLYLKHVSALNGDELVQP
jgi:hypothetical protein